MKLNKQAQELLDEIKIKTAQLEAIINASEPAKGCYEQPDSDNTYQLEYKYYSISYSKTDNINSLYQRNLFNAYSEEMVIREQKRRAVEIKLLKLAQEREKEFPIDWNNFIQRKFYMDMVYSHETKKKMNSFIVTQHHEKPSCIYFAGFKDGDDFREFIRKHLTDEELTDYIMPRRFV